MGSIPGMAPGGAAEIPAARMEMSSRARAAPRHFSTSPIRAATPSRSDAARTQTLDVVAVDMTAHGVELAALHAEFASWFGIRLPTAPPPLPPLPPLPLGPRLAYTPRAAPGRRPDGRARGPVCRRSGRPPRNPRRSFRHPARPPQHLEERPHPRRRGLGLGVL